MAALTGGSFYAGIAQDTIAMAVNDLITVGATPLVVQAYWAAGGSDWFDDAERAEALVAAGSAPATSAASPGAAARRRRSPASSKAAASTSRRPAPASSARRRACRSATGSRPATRSCCSPRAASTPTASASRASWPSGCRAATSRRSPSSAVPISFGEALLAPTVLYSPITEALASRRRRVRTTPSTSPATAGAS